MNKKIRFIPVITLLRGLAALMVCLYHFICGTTDYFNDKLVLKFFEFGDLGVNMFFIISGIVLPLAMLNGNYSISSWKEFLVKRIIRIEPPYIVAFILAALYLFLRSFISNTVALDLTPSWRDIFLHLGYLIPFFDNVRWLNQAFWTLAIEFQYYLLLICLFPLMTSKRLVCRILFYALLLFSALIFRSSAFFPHWSSLFLIGIVYILYQAQKIKKIEYFIVSIIAIIAITYFLGLKSLIVTVFTLSTVHFFPSYNQKYFYFLGTISYSLYLLHGITGSALINVLSHSFNSSYQKPLVVLIGLFFSILCAYIMYLFVEKPSQKFAASIKYKKNNENAEIV